MTRMLSSRTHTSVSSWSRRKTVAGMQRTSPIPEIGILINGNFLTFEILLKPPVLSMENVKKFSSLKRRIFSPGTNNFLPFSKNFFWLVESGHQLVMQPYLDIWWYLKTLDIHEEPPYSTTPTSQKLSSSLSFKYCQWVCQGFVSPAQISIFFNT